MKTLLLLSKGIGAITDVLPKNPSNYKIAFITTAADPYDNKYFVEEDRQKLAAMGFQLIEYDIKQKKKDQLFDELKTFDALYLTGGNTFYLLEKAQESGFTEVINELVEKGIVYIGGSAGAAIAGISIQPVALLDDPSKAPHLQSTDGLGLVNFVILPHYGKEKYANLYKKIMDEYGKKYKLITLTDEQAIIVDENGYKIVKSA